ncbi:hypothetical protein GPM19_10195 [Halomonas sp. ZH2S]|uniref:Uncharacterized protein n=1 Tax=Vreelandella zhuhanensis TaxID=2684210 RepID=A0A7X3H120_9GAMM|nr:hypothetical protein [Halomonas zhuhanensis]MWJ28571.1 hypothetical protein [Halomonas zhuhanensis]
MATFNWSQSLLSQTVETLTTQGMNLVPTPDGHVHFKSLDGRHGSMDVLSLMSGKFEITDKKTYDVERFSTPEAVIAAGWALD